MKQSDLEQQALSLPGDERAALAQALLQSIDQQSAIETTLAAVTDPWFEGESREMTSQDWDRLGRGEYRHAPEPNSAATPPGWKSPRLKK